MASAAEAEVGALFANAQLAAPLRVTLEELGHPQPATPMKTDNSAANGILNGTVKQQRSKAIDMRFCWLKDRAEQGQFKTDLFPRTRLSRSRPGAALNCLHCMFGVRQSKHHRECDAHRCCLPWATTLAAWVDRATFRRRPPSRNGG